MQAIAGPSYAGLANPLLLLRWALNEVNFPAQTNCLSNDVTHMTFMIILSLCHSRIMLQALSRRENVLSMQVEKSNGKLIHGGSVLQLCRHVYLP